MSLSWAQDLSATQEICRGAFCGAVAVGLHFIGIFMAYFIAAGSAFLVIHGLWRAAIRCHRMYRKYGARAIFHDDDKDD